MRLALLLLLAACTTSEPDTRPEPRDPSKAWSASDDPDLFDDALEYRYAALPRSGAVTKVPWAANYWPTWKDSVNHRWAGPDSVSPTAKYGAAFGRDAELEDRVSAAYGIDSIAGRSCSTDADCAGLAGASCAIRTGKTTGTCIETWFGLCHAWAPAAILEDEPVHPVTHNGVTFEVNDLKALVTLSYDAGLTEKFMSLRCDAKGTGDGAMSYDELGTPRPPECADTNAGAFHVVVANYIGLRKQSFVEDRTWDYEVWNQPVRAFRVTRDAVVSASEANRLVGIAEPKTTWGFNADAHTLRHVELELDWIAESSAETTGNLASTIDRYTYTDAYRYILELDAAGKVVGGEWIGASKTEHPDFLWLPVMKQETELAKKSNRTNTGVRWSDVQMLLHASTQDPSASTGFDWGNPCDDGRGSLQQGIREGSVEDVGRIPDDKRDVRVELRSDTDVDIQLVDVQTGTELVAWPNGLLNAADEGCTTFEGVQICYSGYNGDGTQLGHEWIEIRGATQRALQMRAFGYTAGSADVTYTWRALPDCVDAGSGAFDTFLAESQVTDVGVLPAGKRNVRIELSSTADVDIQLFDGETPLVQWPDGQLSGAARGTITHRGLTITYSGYDGDGRGKGHEYLTLSGVLPSDLTMRAFGYVSGAAEVRYAWGLDDSALQTRL
jgi:hypothetical protein